MRIAILDGYNLMHRSRFGVRGPNGIIYTFFRSLRSLIEDLKPEMVYLVLEGVPEHRQQLDGEYKANRRIEPGTPKWDEMVEFRRQKAIIIDLLKKLPITLAVHPKLECDDTIASLAHHHLGDECVIVSTDTDFIQLLALPHVQIFNPIKKTFVENVTYDYVRWKALRGDKTDNVPSVGGMTDKAAEKLLANPKKLEAFLAEGTNATDYERNLTLIQLKVVPYDVIEFSPPSPDFEGLKQVFEGLHFTSLVKESAWKTFTETFTKIY
jgi:5'-3' exonuclease